MLPNKTTIQSTHSGTLPFGSRLSRMASKALVFPGLQNESLLSIGKLCDNNCTEILTKDSVFVMKDEDLIMHGKQNHMDKLWDIKLPSHQPNISPSTPKLNCINYIIVCAYCSYSLCISPGAICLAKQIRRNKNCDVLRLKSDVTCR